MPNARSVHAPASARRALSSHRASKSALQAAFRACEQPAQAASLEPSYCRAPLRRGPRRRARGGGQGAYALPPVPYRIDLHDHFLRPRMAMFCRSHGFSSSPVVTGRPRRLRGSVGNTGSWCRRPCSSTSAIPPRPAWRQARSTRPGAASSISTATDSRSRYRCGSRRSRQPSAS